MVPSLGASINPTKLILQPYTILGGAVEVIEGHLTTVVRTHIPACRGLNPIVVAITNFNCTPSPLDHLYGFIWYYGN